MQLPAPTARVVFRAWRDDDLPHATAVFGDARMTALVGGPFDAAAIAARLATELAFQRDHGIAYWPIVLRNASGVARPGEAGPCAMDRAGAPLGCCGLRPRAPERRVYELGFYVLPPYWGQGIAGEASASVIAHAWRVLDATALFAGHHPENASSRRALEKLGFRYTHHERYPPTGLDHPCYELVRPR